MWGILKKNKFKILFLYKNHKYFLEMVGEKMEFEEQVYRTIRGYNMIAKGDRIVVAVSGGPDSMALLNSLIALKDRLGCELVVAHVNHMIRAVADSETEYVKRFCELNKIQCYIKKADVVTIAQQQKKGTEEMGRIIRYDFFDEVLEESKANKIAIAHNANDNAETVLMNVLRGTGISGLKGIEPVRDNKFIRPLINQERLSIERYCEDCKLDPRFDESNKDNTYTRNKIRNLLIPFLKDEFNPSIIEGLNRLSYLAEQENRYVEELVNREFKKVVITEEKNDNEIILNIKKFNVLDEFIKGKIILLCVSKLFGSTKGIESKHIKDVIKLCENNIGNKYLTPNKHLKVYVGQGKIIISKIMKINSVRVEQVGQ